MNRSRARYGLLALVVVAGCGPDEGADSMTATSNQTSQTSQSGQSGQSGQTNDDTGADPTEGATAGSGTDGPAATTDGPVGGGISGDFLLAIATTVDPGKPLQFIATSAVTEVDGAPSLAICLQPLTLTLGTVSGPRLPVGEPLCFEGVAIVDGGFELDMGTVMISGAANPITGANIVVSLILDAEIKSDDLYCGTVTGEVAEPPVGSIEGSTFAAVRLADPAVLPTQVVIDCKGTTVTD